MFVCCFLLTTYILKLQDARFWTTLTFSTTSKIAHTSHINKHVTAYMSSRVLNHLAVSSMFLEEKTDTIKDLSAFNFDIFHHRTGITADLIGEFPNQYAVVAATSESFWSTVDRAVKYDNDLTQKA